jgi:glycosyltransferase involved in cell wall biosynthesis
MFDIIIPILKMKPKYLHECLASLKAQQHRKFKCYIIDGSPEDWELYKESMDVINSMMKKDRRFEYHRHPNLDEPYVSEAQNYGLSLGSNPYVSFLGGDDFYYPHHLISMKDAIDAELDDDVGFWFSMIQTNNKSIMDFQTFKIGRVRTWLMNHYLSYPHLSKKEYPLFHNGNCIYMNGLVLKRELVEEVEGFNQEYFVGEDIDMVMKIVIRGYHGRWLPYVGAYLRIHSEQSTNGDKIQKMDLERRLQWSKNLAQKSVDYQEYKVGWIRWKTMNEWEEEVDENGGQPIVMDDGKNKMFKGEELEQEMERVGNMLGKQLTPSEYELLRGLTSGTYQEKTNLELIEKEMIFLLRTDDEENNFWENDIVI